MAPFGRSTPTSIHDADSAHTRSSRAARSAGAKAVAAAVAAALIAGGGYWVLRGGDSSEASSDPARSQLAAGPQLDDPDKAHVDVLMDGWSYRTLRDTPVYARVSGTPVALTFAPATAADLKVLVRSNPDLVAAAMARLVTDDPTLACDKTGCATGSGPVSTDLLLDPSAVDVLDKSYEGYDVEHGLYVAQIPTGGSTGAVELSAKGYSSLVIAAAMPESDDGTVLTPGPGNGYLSSRYLLGAGLGHLFPVDPEWLGTDPADPTRYLTSGPSTTAPDDALSRLESDAPAGAATEGLASTFPGAEAWSTGHLTYATSPTTGCGPDVLCVPDVVSADVVRDVRDYATVCSPDGEGTGAAALQDVVVDVSLPAPTHQFGLGDGNGRWGAEPSLVSGEQKLRMAVLGLYDGAELAARASGGRLDAGEPDPITLDDALAGVRFDGVHWGRC